ncbi:hypothetical protein H4F83_05745 [Citrobacter freundii]|nr:hypothetical protein [Citrobacter freundii]
MKTNHPAHGPVSLARLHQIREILSKASAQSDGGNLGYAMADAVKVIDGVIAARSVEAIYQVMYGEYWRDITEEQYHDHAIHESPIRIVYTSPPAPVVPDELTREEYRRRFMMEDNFDDTYRGGWSACRAAMLQAGNSPVARDGWVMVPKEITCEMDDAAWDAYHETRSMSDIWSALLAAALQQEVKSE